MEVAVRGHHPVSCTTQRKEFNIEKFWELEAIGISACNELSDASQTAEIELVDGRYSAKMPWKIAKEHLRDTNSVALSRLSRLTNKLMRDYDKMQEYDDGMRQLLSDSCAEAVSEKSSGNSYYVPHRPVYRDDKETTKMRIDFDASCLLI
ncbi:uncharacterized protein LOC108598354 [Drosophila busckii]|uniref:uncharacterized protein LOC108598354 n=1 Tax=Drosophila busckii TaxID=30019 RepID=UPI00083F4227|nr:uncharacterized protein LOC108598354 [Drosophila busckii]